MALSGFLVLASCGSGSNQQTDGGGSASLAMSGPRGQDPNVFVHQLGDPEKLNPLTSTDASAQYIQRYLFSTLLEYDINTLKLIPLLALELPEVKEVEEGPYAGGMSITYEIHPQAKWDNGKNILASDYVFSLKVLKNPRVESGPLRSYYEFIHNIEIDPSNPRRFTVWSKERYFKAEENTASLIIIPEYHYDPEKLMAKFKLSDFADAQALKVIENDPDLERFAKAFNTQYDRQGLVGSGPYRFVEWIPKEKIVLQRKKDWWGDAIKERENLRAYPESLVYRIITDWETAVSESKAQEMDVLYSVPPDKFSELKTNSNFTNLYELSTPLSYSYVYLGLNSKGEIFKDKAVRKAFAHIVDYEEITTVLYEDMAERLVGPIHPSKTHYNKNLRLPEHDLAKAKALLEEAGWKDTDGDGILDKVVNGKKIPLRVIYKYNTENQIRKNIGLFLQNHGKSIGVDVQLEGKEWSVFLKDIKKRSFDLMCLGWSQPPGNEELKQIWHSSSDMPDGSNYVGFGNAESDALIDSIRVTLDPEKRKQLFFRMQEIIHEEQPYIFLVVPKERIVIHRRFDNAFSTPLRPGFREASFMLKKASAEATK